MVDLANEVKSLTSAMRNNCLELVNLGLHWLIGKPMLPAVDMIFSQELFLRINFLYFFTKSCQTGAHGTF